MFCLLLLTVLIVYRSQLGLDNCDGFKKGDYVVIDALHHDHLEVFDKHGEWKRVANFDGTINEKKTEQGAKVPRERLKEG